MLQEVADLDKDDSDDDDDDDEAENGTGDKQDKGKGKALDLSDADEDEDDSDDDDDDDEDETAELLRELEKIKKERAEEKERQVSDTRGGPEHRGPLSDPPGPRLSFVIADTDYEVFYL